MTQYAYGARKVIWHVHVFPSSQPWQSDDESCRFDAVEFEDGEIAVTDPNSEPPHRIVTVCKTRNEAETEALHWANKAWTQKEERERP